MRKITETGVSQGDLVQYLKNLRTRPLESFQITKSGNFDFWVSNKCAFAIDGVVHRSNWYTSIDTGTAQHCAAGNWNCALISVAAPALGQKHKLGTSDPAFTVTWPSGTTGYGSEADAIANMASCPSGECPVAYYTVQASATAPWTAGTDAFYGKTVTGTQHLSETTFGTHANWDVTGDVTDSTGKAVFANSGGINGTLIQTYDSRASAGTNSTGYQFKYTIAVTTAPDGDFTLVLSAFSSASVSLPFTAGTHLVSFLSATDASTADFLITAAETTSTEGNFSMDNVSLKLTTSAQDDNVYNALDILNMKLI